MNFLKIKNTILAALGRVKTMDKLHVDRYTEDKIQNITGIKIATAKEGQIWVSFQDLNGFLFMNANIISKTSLKSNKGANIILSTNNETIELVSDEKVIKSEFSNVSNNWITSVSFIINDNEKKLIKFRAFDSMNYVHKKGNLAFMVYK